MIQTKTIAMLLLVAVATIGMTATTVQLAHAQAATGAEHFQNCFGGAQDSVKKQ